MEWFYMYFLIPNQMVIFILKPQTKAAGISKDPVAAHTPGSATCQQPGQDQSRSICAPADLWQKYDHAKKSVPCPVGEGPCRFIPRMNMKAKKMLGIVPSCHLSCDDKGS